MYGQHKPQNEIPRIAVSVIVDRMVRTILVIISLARSIQADDVHTMPQCHGKLTQLIRPETAWQTRGTREHGCSCDPEGEGGHT